MSIPLPLFDRNQDRVRKARAEAAAVEARVIQTEFMPRADAVLKSAESRYAAGDESLTDVLLIPREWAEIRLGHPAALRDVMQAWAGLSAYMKSP